MTSPSARTPLLVLIILIVIGAMAAWLASRETSDHATLSLAYPATAYVQGASLEAWTTRHWQWTLSFPAAISPGQDVTGESCTVGQSGPVVFIPRNLPPCTVPEGVAILVPIAGGECSSVEAAPFWGGDEAELRACAAGEAERYQNISVTVDGQPIPGIDQYRTSTPAFSVTLPARNVLGVEPGAAWVAADGYHVLLRPLPIGEHRIIVHTETVDGVVLPDKLLEVTVIEPEWTGPAIYDVATPLATPAASPIATPQPR